MAACPECGGHLNPAELLADVAGAATCRWCRAEVELHPLTRVARNVVFLGGGALLVLACGVLFVQTRDMIWPILGLAGLLATAFVTIAWIHFTPLVVVVPRGARKPWSRSRPAREPREPRDPPAVRDSRAAREPRAAHEPRAAREPRPAREPHDGSPGASSH